MYRYGFKQDSPFYLVGNAYNYLQSTIDHKWLN